MIENKRFGLAYDHGDWWAVRDGDITLWKEEVVDLLNKLFDENQFLKNSETIARFEIGAILNQQDN